MSLALPRTLLRLILLATVGVTPAIAGQVDGGVLAGIGPVIRIGGVITRGDEAVFHDLASRIPNPTVMLSGPGGAVDPALTIGFEIRARGLTTLVPAEMSCASACALIWVAGARRKLGAGARIGFHAMSLTQGNGGRMESHEYDSTLRSYLTRLGFAMDATATMVNTPSALVRWLDALELNANGIETESVP